MLRLIVLVVTAVFGLALLQPAISGTFKLVADVPGSDDGVEPTGPLVHFGNAIYGTTRLGGKFLGGSIFRLDTGTNAVRSVYSFTQGSDGAQPTGLVRLGAMLYGVTATSRSTDAKILQDTIFQFDPATGLFKTVYTFSNTNAGAYHPTGLVAISGKLYTALAFGGASNAGAVLRFDPVDGSATLIYSFTGQADGKQPGASLTAYAGYLYGTNLFGGPDSAGVIFRIDPASGAEINLAGIIYGVGLEINAALVGAGNALYGVSVYGGASQSLNGYGTVFKLDLHTLQLQRLYSFTGGVDGGNPVAGLAYAHGLLYGTTHGGIKNLGTAFTVNPTTGHVKTIFNLAVPGHGTGFSETALLDVSGTLYGATVSGGLAAEGTLFKFTASPHSLETLYSFNGARFSQNYGVVPSGHVLYSVATQGGVSKLGAIFKIDLQTDELTTLASFSGGKNGYWPYTPLVAVGADLYGTTRGSTTDVSNGTVFKLDEATGTLTTLLTVKPSLAQNIASLNAFNGCLYGTSSEGVALKIPLDAPGSVQKFTLAAPNLNLYGGLVESDGNLFGATEYGSTSLAQYGTLLEFSPANGTPQTIVNFDNSDGYSAPSRMVARSGLLYGTTFLGGSHDAGTIFVLNPKIGKLFTLYDFDVTGISVYLGTPGVVVGDVLYGTGNGGYYNQGAIFAFDLKTRAMTVLHSFTGGSDGSSPSAALVYANGVLYGTTDMGGSYNRGTVFSYTP